MIALLLQTSSVFVDIDRLTLSSAAIIAVAVLWRALTYKDTLLIKMVETVTGSIVTSAQANAELRKIIEDSVETKRRLVEAIERMEIRMGGIPCLMPDEEREEIEPKLKVK